MYIIQSIFGESQHNKLAQSSHKPSTSMAVDIGICFLTHINKHPYMHMHARTDIYTCIRLSNV